MDRFDFLFERLAKFWLPADEETGDRQKDVQRAFDMQHTTSKGAMARIISGLAVVGSNETLAAFDANPERDLPNWLEHRSVDTKLNSVSVCE